MIFQSEVYDVALTDELVQRLERPVYVKVPVTVTDHKSIVVPLRYVAVFIPLVELLSYVLKSDW